MYRMEQKNRRRAFSVCAPLTTHAADTELNSCALGSAFVRLLCACTHSYAVYGVCVCVCASYAIGGIASAKHA